MIWLNMASTLGPLPLGEDAALGAKGESGGRVDMMGEKKRDEYRERKRRG
jgi:hypothetical protein